MGRQVLWIAIMGDGYMRVVKKAVEEGMELLGYTLILIGTLEFLRETVCAVDKARRCSRNDVMGAESATHPIARLSICRESGEQKSCSHVYHSRYR